MITMQNTAAPEELPTKNIQMPPSPTTVPLEIDELAQFRLPAGLESAVAVTRVISQVRVQKPHREMWIRTMQDRSTWQAWQLLELKSEGEYYFVDASIAESLLGEPALVRACLVPTVTTRQTYFYWPLKLPDASGKTNSWNGSAMAAAVEARDRWVRVVAELEAQSYMPRTGDFTLEPHWPKEPQSELLKIALRGRTITSLDHPVVQRLQGLKP